MNTIEYLFALQKKHTFYKNSLDDLETLIDVFEKVDETFIEQNFFCALDLNVEQFLKKLQEELENASETEIVKFAIMIEDYINVKNNRLLDCIKKAIFRYGVRHPKFDTQKYFNSFVSGIISEIEEDLYAKVVVSFLEEAPNKYTSAAIYNNFFSIKDKHSVILYPKNTETQWENRIFGILRSLYHEEFHMLVDEMQLNPDCFKLDILNYQKVEIFRTIAENTKSIYQKNYIYLQEEVEAAIFGTHKANQKIKELNPAFAFSKIDTENYSDLMHIMANKYETTYKIGFFKRISQKEFLDQQLDELLPQNPDCIYGMLSRIYNKNGTRKSFQTLVSDYEAVKKERKNVPIEKIETFYAETLYEAYVKSDEQEKNVITNDNYLFSYLLQSLKKKSNQMEEEVQELKKKEDLSLTEKLKRKYKIRILEKELGQVKKELESVNREEKTIYGL